MARSKGLFLSPPRAARFSSRNRLSTSGRWARIWNSQVVALLDASWDAKRKVNSVSEISSFVNSRIMFLGFSKLVSPAATLSRYRLDSIMWSTQWSTIHVGVAPFAMFALHLAAHSANTRWTASAVLFPSQVLVNGTYIDKGILTRSRASVAR